MTETIIHTLQSVQLFRLADAVRRFFPADSGITVKSLRTEARYGRLCITRIAGKDFVTPEAIQKMMEACAQWHGNGNHPASTCGTTARDAKPSGSSWMERERLARAAALAAAKKPGRR